MIRIATYKRCLVPMLVLAICAAAGRPACGEGFGPDSYEAVRLKTQWLAGVPSRVVGTPGHAEVVSRLLKEVRELPGVHVWEHRYSVVVPQTIRAELTVFDQGPLAGSHRIYPLWPASVRLNTTPRGGLTGRPVYIGKATISDVPPQSLRGQIAVMELSGGDGWRLAAEAGATAIILLDDNQATHLDVAGHFMPLPFNTPRFHVPEGPLAEALRSGRLSRIRLDSSGRWAEVEATNIYVLVPSRQGQPPRNALAVAAPIDSAGVIAELAPGADAALDAATLLVAMRHFAHNPPALPLIFALVDANSINQLGMRKMHGVMSMPLLDRRNAQKEEVRTLSQYRALKELSNELSAEVDALAVLHAPRYRELHPTVRREIDLDISVIEAELQTLRLEKIAATDEHLAAIDGRISELLERRTHLRTVQRSMLTSRPMSEPLTPTAEAVWQRTSRRIAAQYEQTRVVVEMLDDDQRMRREMLDALGLVTVSDDTRPAAFLLGLDLSDAGVKVGPSRFCAFHQVDEMANTRILREWLRRRADGDDNQIWDAEAMRYVNLDPFQSLSAIGTHTIGRLATMTSPAMALGMPAATWATLEGERLRVDTPADNFESLDWSRLNPQIAVTLSLLEALAADAHFARDAGISHPKWARLGGAIVDYAPGEPVARLPMAGYVTTLIAGHGRPEQCVPAPHMRAIAGLRRQEFAISGADGRFRFDLMPARMPGWSRLHEVYLQSCKLDDDGSIIRSLDYRRSGRGSMLTADLATAVKAMNMRGVPFSCREVSAFGLYDARFLMPLEAGSLLDARSMSAPKRGNVSFFGGVAAMQVEPQLWWLLILRAGITRNRMVLMNMEAPDLQPEASARDLVSGFGPGEPLPHEPAYLAAMDWYNLNQLRLDQYRKAGITSLAIEQIRENTRQSLHDAQAALDADDGLRFRQAAGAAMSNESAAYQAALDTAADTIRGAIFLLLMLVPFSFAMERLLLASPNIYRQILYTMGIFILMTAILWSFHPAFRISSQPLTIIMAFAIICLALLVTSMVYSKFSAELEKIRSGRAEASGARTSRTGVLYTAIRLGIANMRKRKLRTALTGLTVVLITFALLCFVSTSRYVDYYHHTLSAPAEFTGVLLRNAGSRAMPPRALEEVSSYLAPHHKLIPRYWWAVGNATWRLNVYNLDGGRQAEFAAALGLDPDEERISAIAEVCPNWQRFKEQGGCYMSIQRARQLEVSPGDTVIVAGQPLELIDVFDPQQFDSSILDLDGWPLTPADYAALSQDQIDDINRTDLARLAHEERGGVGSSEDSGLPVLSSATVLIVRGDMLRRSLDAAQLRGLAVAASDADEARDLARKLADRYAFVVTYGTKGQQAAILARVPLVPTAPRSLIVPLLIGGLIIFNTMLSSLAERRREIYVYTSLGLAPLHVGFLFLAEAMTYGLMGTIFGYVVGQGVATGLSGLGWLGDITLNYSGTQAIMIMVMVLAVVMVSSLVPAYLAGRLAAPSNARSWQVPRPRGNLIEDVLPFTVTPGTAAAVADFLYEFLDAHREGVIGDFSTDDLRTVAPDADDQPGFGIKATVWLAPYDLGVRQEVSLTVRQEEQDEQDQLLRVHVQINRASGSVATWHKLNRSFLGSLRRQLLGWRKLGRERMMVYIEQGAAMRAAALAAVHVAEQTPAEEDDVAVGTKS